MTMFLVHDSEDSSTNWRSPVGISTLLGDPQLLSFAAGVDIGSQGHTRGRILLPGVVGGARACFRAGPWPARTACPRVRRGSRVKSSSQAENVTGSLEANAMRT